MATPHDLQEILNEILESKYGGLVRSLGDLRSIKSGGDEKYFNLSPNERFSGRMINLTVSRNGEFRLGASYGKILAQQAAIEKIMRDLTGNQPEHGTTMVEELRLDILRSTINSHDRRHAANLFTRFYDLTESIMTS